MNNKGQANKIEVEFRNVFKKQGGDWGGVFEKVTQHIPTMTKSHHGGEMSVMIKVGICQ